MLCLLGRVDDVRAKSSCQIAPAQQLGLTHYLGISGGGQAHQCLYERTKQMWLVSSKSCKTCQNFASLRRKELTQHRLCMSVESGCLPSD